MPSFQLLSYGTILLGPKDCSKHQSSTIIRSMESPMRSTFVREGSCRCRSRLKSSSAELLLVNQGLIWYWNAWGTCSSSFLFVAPLAAAAMVKVMTMLLMVFIASDSRDHCAYSCWCWKHVISLSWSPPIATSTYYYCNRSRTYLDTVYRYR